MGLLPLVQTHAMHTPHWVPVNAQWGRVAGVADQSALNQPITPAHALAVVGSHFMAMGSDGVVGTVDDTRVRLFGINLGRDACFPPPEKAAEVAATLRSLGFNAVRLHQMDAAPTDDPDVFQSSLTLGPYPSLHTGALDRLRHFIAALKAEGIYTNLNLMVGYVFRPGVDGVPALDPEGTPPGYGSPVHVFFPKMVALQIEHARRLLEALQLRGESALAQVEIINESSLAATWLHWDKTHWEKQIRGDYATELDTQWQHWVTQTHGNMHAACMKWGTCAHETGRMPTPAQADALQHAVPVEGWGHVWVRLKQKWAHWIAALRNTLGMKANGTPTAKDTHPKVLDALKFVADTDRRFLDTMRSVVQNATRPTLPVTGTQMDFGAPLNFHSHRSMDYVDAHFYVDHPVFPGVPWSDTDWYFHNETVSGQEMGQLLSLATYRDASKPFVVSEYNQPYPNTHGHDILPVTAAFAAQQNWDGLYFFAYGGTEENPNTPAHFFLQGDWAKASVVGLAARMFRTASVPALQSTMPISTQPSQWWEAAAQERRPDTWTRYLTHQQLFSNAMVLNHAVSLSEYPLAQADQANTLPAMEHLPGERRVSIEASTVNALLGEVAAHTPTRTGHLTIEVDSTETRHRTAVVLHSMDGLPVTTSRHLLLATPAPLTGTHHSGTQPRPQRRIPYRSETGKWTLEPAPPHQNHPSSPRSSMAPIWLDRQPLTVTVATTRTHAQVYPLSSNGQRMQALTDASAHITPAGLELKLGTASTPVALWYEVVFP